MIFNSLEFVAFWLAVILLLLVVRGVAKDAKVRNVVLLVASYAFYGYFNVGFLLILLYVTLVTFAFASVLLNDTLGSRKRIVGTGIVLSLLPLVFYKYAMFIVNSVSGLLGSDIDTGTWGKWCVPVGISFFTFQALSYLIDVYRRRITEGSSLVDYMLFVSFFPTILSGPIEKARELLPQIRRNNPITRSGIADGLVVFAWGLFKKVVIADRLSAYVDWAYLDIAHQSGGTLAFAATLYSIQIYCDFSGYSDMAWGVAKSLGFDVTRNFRFPYFASTIKEFWRRWHISLTSWFTEYVYFSLGGNRVKLKAHWVFNISMVFLLSGIWHGASWNFFIWGALHAVYYLIEYACGLHRKEYRTPSLLKLPATLLVFALVTVAWIFFRIEDFSAATCVLNKIVTDIASPIAVGQSAFTFVCNILLVAVFVVYDLLLYKGICLNERDCTRQTIGNVLWLVSLMLLTALCSVSADNFVYFQF